MCSAIPQRQSALADAARTDEGQQPDAWILEHRFERCEHRASTDKCGELLRQIEAMNRNQARWIGLMNAIDSYKLARLRHPAIPFIDSAHHTVVAARIFTPICKTITAQNGERPLHWLDAGPFSSKREKELSGYRLAVEPDPRRCGFRSHCSTRERFLHLQD